MKLRKNPYLRNALLSATLFGTSTVVNAATHEYTGTTAGTYNWTSPTDWTGGGAVSGIDTILSYTSPLAAGVNIVSNNDIASPPFKLNQLSFTNDGPASGTAPTLTLTGSQLEFITNTALATPTLIFNTTGTIKPVIDIQNTLLLTNNLAVTATTNGTLSGAITGAGTLTKSGAGTVTLSGANTYTGLTTVSGGILKLGNAGALGNGTTNTSGVTLTSGSFDFASFTPTANVALNLNSSAATADFGSILNSSAGTAVSYGGTVSLGTATVVVGTTGTSLTFTNTITGNSRGLRKDGTGSLILSNSGTVTLAALAANRGTIQVNSGTTLNVTSITVGSGNSVGSGLTLNGGNVTSTGAALFGTATTGTASGTLQLNAGSTLTVPSLNKGPSAGGSVVFNANFNGGTLKANAASATFFTGANNAKIQSGGLTINDGGFAITVGQTLIEDSGSTGGALTKTGRGTLTLTGPNTYTGGTNVNAGTLVWSGANALPTTGTIAVGATGNFSLADGTARSSTTPALTLANGSRLSFDWTGANVGDQLTSTANVTPTAGSVIGISITPSGTPSGSVTLLTGGAGSTLSSSSFYLANNTNYTATLTTAPTTVSIGSYATATALTNAYWKGGQVTGQLGSMAFSSGTTSNWASAAAGTAAGGVVPGSTANVIFSATGATQQSAVTMGADMTVSSLTFNDSTAVTIGSGYNLTLLSTSATAATSSGSGTTVTAGSAITVTSSANATNTINAGVFLGANQTWNVASAKTLAVSGEVAGNFTLTKGGAGSLDLSGTNTYTGATTVQGGGTLKVSGTGVIAPTTGAALNLGASASAGTFQYDSSGSSKFAGIIVGNGTSNVGTLNQTSGTITGTSLTLNNGYSSTGAGTVALSGGTMTISGATVLSNQTASDNILSTFTISGASTIFNANGELRLTGLPATTRFANGKLVQTSGTVNVAGTNGLLLVQGTSGNTAIRRGQYDLNGGTLNVNTITSTSTAAADAVAIFNFNGGTLKPTASSTTFWVTNAQTTANVQDGGAKIDTDGKDITIAQPLVHFSGATTDTLTKSGLGTLTLTGTNTYTGATQVNAGRLVVNGNQTSATGTVTVAAGTLTGTPVATLAGSGTGSNGTIGGDVALTAESALGFKNGGVLAPSASASGTALKVNGATTFGTGSIFEWNMSATDPTTDPGVVSNSGSYGQLTGTGIVGGSGAVFNVLLGSGNAFTDVFWNTDKSWTNVFTQSNVTTNTLASIFSGGFGGAGVDSAGLVSGRGQFTFNGGTTSTLTWTAVPEPTSALAGLLLTAGLLRRRRA